MFTKLLRILPLLLLVMFRPEARGATAEYTMPKDDKKCETQLVDGSMLFYDHGGATGNVASVYYKTLCVFKAANEGDELTITFNKVDLDGPILYIYDGEINNHLNVTEGYVGSLTGQSTGETFSAPSGTLSVLYYSEGYNNKGAGFEALIEAAPTTDMVWSSVTPAPVSAMAYPGATAVPLLCMDLLTDGGANPLSLEQMTFTLSGSGLTGLTNLRCLVGRDPSSPAGAAQFGEVAEGASTLTFTGNHTLKPKHNYVWLVADFKPEAVAATTVTVGCSAVNVAGVQRLADSYTAPEPIEVKNMVLMPHEPLTFSVGDNPILFYDDGGPDAPYSQDFTGSVTFTPSHEGKKVCIRFDKVTLFDTSSVGYNDKLNIYHGTTADEQALAASVLSQPLTVHSTSPDGALTVTFTSTTGYPKDGWAATVEEFEPQPMTATALTVAATDATTTSAGTPADALRFSIATTGTEPALTLSAVKVSTAGSTAAISSVSLSDAAGHSLGAADVTGSETSLTLATPVALGEHGNDFIISVTPAATALTGETISVSLSAATLSTGEMTPSAEASAQLTVENVCLLTKGAHSHIINGDWQLANEPHPTNSYLAYEGTAGERKVTLTPATEGMFIEVDFESFSINWPYYGYEPLFKIYSGAEATGTPIWAMTKATAKTGPGVPVRSTAADGSLTIVFDPNGNNGASGDGFKAAVRQYIPTPMQLASVAVSQSNTDPVLSGDTDAEILRIALTTTGDQNPLALSEMKINLKDAAGSVAKVKLYSTGKADSFTQPVLIAEAEPLASDTEVILSPVSYRLPEKTSYLWIAYDMLPVIEPGHAIDASIISMTVEGEKVKDISDPDPEGERIATAIYRFTNGDNVVDVPGSLLFYDDGGPDGKYTNTAKGTVNFRPRQGEIVSMEFINFYTNVSDHFYVYDGAGTEGILRANLYSSKENLPVIYSNAPDGSLTVAFNPVKNNTNQGWYIRVTSIAPEDLYVTNTTLTAYKDARLLRGAKDAPIACLKVEVGGNRGPVPMDEFEFDTTGTTAGLISAFSLTASDMTDSYDAVNMVGSSATGVIPTPGLQLSAPGTYYYWLRADINAEAADGASLAVKLAGIRSGDKAQTIAAGEPVTLALTAGLAGEYHVGSSDGADYPTLQAAADALATNGVEAPVTMLVESGDYNELLAISNIPGASEDHTVTFRSATGNRDEVTVHYDRYQSSYGSPEYGVITLDNAQWVSIESITVTSQASDFPMLVKVGGASRHFTLRDCHIHSPHCTSYSNPTLVECSVGSESVPNRNNDFATIADCLLEGGYIGVQIGGTSVVNPVRLPREKGGLIEGNTFVGQGSKAIYINNEDACIVRRNYIESDDNAGKSWYGIDAYQANEGFTIDANTILHRVPKGSSRGIYTRPMRGSATARTLITNNEIVLLGSTGSDAGIYIGGGSDSNDNLVVAGNSVRITGTAIGSTAFYITSAMPGGIVTDNIFDNAAQGYAVRITALEQEKLPVFSANMLRSVVADKLAEYGDLDPMTTIEQWNTTMNDATSFTAEVAYLADDVLEPLDFTPLIHGVPSPYLTTDIAGLTRDADTPTVGAYEATELSLTPAPAEGFPTVDRVTHESARLSLQANCHGAALVLIRTADAAVPAPEDFGEEALPMELRKGRTATLALTGLQPKQQYCAYILITSLRGETGEVCASPLFTTTFAPTETATFEAVTPDETEPGTFTDGTARFSGFIVEEQENLPVPGSLRAAVMEDTEATVTLTNASNVRIDGFWLTNSAPLTITARLEDEAATAPSKTLEPAEWRYVNLRDMGEIAGLVLYTEGSAAIDDFAGAPASLAASVQTPEGRVTGGEDFTLTAVVEGGVAPFTYLWTDSARQMLGTDVALTLNADRTAVYSLSVTDAWGNTFDATARVNVNGEMIVGTFDDLYLEPDSEWVGDKNDPDYTSGTFLTGSFELTNYYMADWNSWSWFGYSSREGDSYNGLADQMVCAAGSGLNGSQNFGVSFMGEYYGPTLLRFTNSEEPQVIPGLWVTNTAWVKDAVLNGDGMSDAFAQGDYCSVKVSGILPDGTYTEPAEIILADYRPEQEIDRYLLDTWQWQPLSQLGAVTGLRFEFFSTKSNSYGITTPSYVCLDNLGDKMPVESTEAVTVPDDMRAIALSDYFDFDQQEGSVTYTLLSGEATIAGDEAIVTAAIGADTTLLIHGTQRGVSQWKEIPVLVTVAGLSTLDASTATGVDIYTPSGLHIYSNDQSAAIPTLSPGVYIIVRHTPAGDLRSVERR